MSQTKAQLISGTSSQSVTFNDATISSLNGGALSGARNRIINGDMRIDQRNAGASSTAAGYTVDRWGYYQTQTSKGTWQQNLNSVTPPAGFKNYLGFASSSAYSVTASDTFQFYQVIEGFNFADFGWGAAGAAAVTVSFWVRSSLTGAFGACLTNATNTRNYPFTYNILSANTWEQKTITVLGDTTGTWLTTNGSGVSLAFSLGHGSNFSGTAGAWNGTASAIFPTGATSVVGTNGATFYITGVQLEAGSVATPFERRSYGQELSLCQRYYEKSYDQSVVPGTSTYAGIFCAVGSNASSCGGFTWKVTKRAAPTVTLYSNDGTSGAVDKLASGTKVTGATANNIAENSFRFVGLSTTVESHMYHYTLSAEL